VRNATFWEALASSYDIGRTRGIDAALSQHQLDALVLPGIDFNSGPSAIAGYPIVTVPLGFLPSDIKPIERYFPGSNVYFPAPNIPFGLNFFASAWSEYELIGFAYAYEQATKTRLKRKAYHDAIPRAQLVDVIKGTRS
jgi:amidase